MRRFVCLAAVLTLAASGAARAEQKDDCKAVIDKAIKATGGEERLAKIKAFTFTMKGKFYGMGDGIDYTGELAVQVPDKSRIKIDGEIDGKKVTFFVQVANGNKVWRKVGDNTEEITDKDKIAEIQEERYADRLNSLLPLVQDKDFKLDPLGEVKVDGKLAVGVRVSHQGHRDINLFFDKSSGLLVKTERTVKDEATDKEVTQETIYSDYKEIDGVMHPLMLVISRDGKKYVDGTISDFEVKDKIEASEFAKP
jgi:outer membrane lipoprotein-sorting protein